jgi:hypothetical protein
MQHTPLIRVLEPADSYDLVTVDYVKAFLNITTDTDDARIAALITFASKVIADICDRVFALEKVEETTVLNGSAEGGLVLNRYPIVDIDSIYNDDNSIIDDITVYDAGGGVLHGDLVGTNIITYSGGYELPDEAPGPLQLACIDLIRSTYYLGSRDPSMQSITDNATGSIRFFPPPGMSRTGAPSKASPLSPQATALIQPYKRLYVA